MTLKDTDCFQLKGQLVKEEDEQIVVAKWLDKREVLWYHVPNGGYRFIGIAVKMRKMGLKAGVPDICVCEPRGSWHGAYGELKRSEGVLSEVQRKWLEELEVRGYWSFVGMGAQDFIEKIEGYLDYDKF